MREFLATKAVWQEGAVGLLEASVAQNELMVCLLDCFLCGVYQYLK